MPTNDKIQKGVLSTPINKEVLDQFRAKCKELNIPMNTVVEVFCKEFNKGKFELTFSRRLVSIDIVDEDAE